MSDNSTPEPAPRKVADPRRQRGDRPKKPYPDFPLSPHAVGTWQKKINGKIYYFGRWGRIVNGVMQRIDGDGWKEALEQYKAVADDLHAGRTPRVNWDQLTVAGLCNAFLTAKLRQRDAGELGLRSFAEYRQTTDLLVAAFGKLRVVEDLAADDFEKLRATMAERWGPVRLGTEIQKVRTVFKYGYEAGLLKAPVRYGPQFKKPPARVMRKHRAASGEKMLEAADIRRLIAAAPVPLRTMILLGVNCGFGNGDCSALPLAALDLDAGWVTYPRPKTGVPRRCPLWPETAAALREALSLRPKPTLKDDAELVFLNARGGPWISLRENNRTDGVTVQFGLLLKRLSLSRRGLGFYALRHVFRTVADAARDPVAIDLIMGHADPSMGGHYRERIEDDRLRAVAAHVRRWLFGAEGDNGPEGKGPGGDTLPAVPPAVPRENFGQDFCDPSNPSNPASIPPYTPGSQGLEGSQKSAPKFLPDERTALRLYVG